MKKKSSNPLPIIRKLYCSIFGHNYALSKKVTNHIKEYECLHCKQQATTNGNGNLEVMTPKLKEINETIASVYAKKLARSSKSGTIFPAA